MEKGKKYQKDPFIIIIKKNVDYFIHTVVKSEKGQEHEEKEEVYL